MAAAAKIQNKLQQTSKNPLVECLLHCTEWNISPRPDIIIGLTDLSLSLPLNICISFPFIYGLTSICIWKDMGLGLKSSSSSLQMIAQSNF